MLAKPFGAADLMKLIARGVMHDYPDEYRKVLQKESAAFKSSGSFEKHKRQLLIKLSPQENEDFRSHAGRMGLGPCELAGLLLERFAHEFPAHLREQAFGDLKSDASPSADA